MRIYRLDNPWALLFAIFPLICILSLILSRMVFKKGVRISGVSGFEINSSLLSWGFYFTQFVIILGLFIIVFSLTKPQYGIKNERITTEGIDIMIALDTSFSMLENDNLILNKIDTAKNIITKFIEKRNGDRIGLVIFADSSILKCPATLNYNLLKNIINQIKITQEQSMGTLTAIGVGLASALNRLVDLKSNDENNQSKIIILVTDGINNTGEITPQAAAEIAQQYGIKVYTIGIGADNKLDINLLQLISTKTHGKFFHAKTSGELGTIFDDINKIEKHKIETLEFTRFKSVGYKYAYLGIILLIFGLLLESLFFKRLS